MSFEANNPSMMSKNAKRSEDPSTFRAPNIEGLEILEKLGAGGMSVVYKARQILVDRIVAVKVLLNPGGEDGQKRFQKEAKLTSTLEHPNIVKIISFGVSHDGQLYLVMEYLDGLSLQEELKRNGPPTLKRFQEVFLPALAALEKAHGLGLIHRDIKPGNIMLCKTETGAETVKLVDFGIAKVFGESKAQQLTKSDVLLGSPTYMSPEQCLGQPLDSRSDLYSLACVMYETLCGEPPFSGQTALDIMLKHSSEPPPSVSELSRKIDIRKELASVTLWGLAKDPAQRPQTASQFASKLNQALESITLDKAPMLKTPAGNVSGPMRWRLIGITFALLSIGVISWKLLADKTGVRAEIAKPPLKIVSSQKKLARLDDEGKLPEKPEDRCVFFLRQAKRAEKAFAIDAAESHQKSHTEAVLAAYKNAVPYTLVNGKESLLTARCNSMVASAAMLLFQEERDYVYLETAWDYAKKALKGLEKEGQIPDLPDKWVLPDEVLPNTITATITAYEILATVIEFMPQGHGTEKEAIDYCEEAIKLAESDDWQCGLAGQCALTEISLLLKQGKNVDASAIVDQVSHAMKKAENNKRLAEQDVLFWGPVESAYNRLGEKQKAAEVRKHIKEIESKFKR